MNLTNEQITAAITAGIAITDTTSDVMVPMKHAAGVVVLHSLLKGIAAGAIRLSAVKGMDPAPKPAEETPQPDGIPAEGPHE